MTRSMTSSMLVQNIVLPGGGCTWRHDDTSNRQLKPTLKKGGLGNGGALTRGSQSPNPCIILRAVFAPSTVCYMINSQEDISDVARAVWWRKNSQGLRDKRRPSSGATQKNPLWLKDDSQYEARVQCGVPPITRQANTPSLDSAFLLYKC